MNKCSELLNTFQFAPFLMWNDHDLKFNEQINNTNLALNKMNIDSNNINIDKDNKDYINIMKNTFFSLENMDIIHYRIIMGVFYKSNENLKIKKIKNETLIHVMNHIWINYCNFLPYKIKEQIDELDNKVVKYIVPLLLKEAEFYFNYLRDINRSNLPLIDRPIMTSHRNML